MSLKFTITFLLYTYQSGCQLSRMSDLQHNWRNKYGTKYNNTTLITAGEEPCFYHHGHGDYGCTRRLSNPCQCHSVGSQYGACGNINTSCSHGNPSLVHGNPTLGHGNPTGGLGYPSLGHGCNGVELQSFQHFPTLYRRRSSTPICTLNASICPPCACSQITGNMSSDINSYQNHPMIMGVPSYADQASSSQLMFQPMVNSLGNHVIQTTTTGNGNRCIKSDTLPFPPPYTEKKQQPPQVNEHKNSEIYFI